MRGRGLKRLRSVQPSEPGTPPSRASAVATTNSGPMPTHCRSYQLPSPSSPTPSDHRVPPGCQHAVALCDGMLTIRSSSSRTEGHLYGATRRLSRRLTSETCGSPPVLDARRRSSRIPRIPRKPGDHGGLVPRSRIIQSEAAPLQLPSSRVWTATCRNSTRTDREHGDGLAGR